MPQRAALLISTALTVLTLVAGIGLSVHVLRSDAEQTTQNDAAVSDADQQRESDYRELFALVESSNAALSASYTRIAGLLDEVDRLRSENATLREREAQYQQRLAEATKRLAERGEQASADPAETPESDERHGG
ncbi:MAG: hypothetical protein U0893_02400 [Chloroflexota bacterium]